MSLNRTLSSSRCFLPIGLLLLTAAIAGCGSGALSSGVSDPSSSTFSGISGSAFGGQQPVAGATIQFYSAGATGYGSTARPLVGCTGVADSNGVPTAPCSGVSTNAGGSFTISTPIVCPPNAYVYVTATGGNPGGPTGSKDNDALALMTGLGACSGITSQTYVNINEVTTAASVTALQQFMSATYGTAFAENVGAPSTNLTGLANAFAAIPQLVNTVNGSAIATSSNTAMVNGTAVQLFWQAQSEKLNTLGNILSNCVNTNDTAASDSTPETISTACSSFFSAVKPTGQTDAPADTIQAMLDIAQNPSSVSGPFTYAANASPPFNPALNLADPPNDWQLTLSYYSGASTKFASTSSQPFLGDAYDLAVDSGGHIWVMNIYGDGSTSEIGPGGIPMAQVLNGTTTTELPRGIAIDTNDNIWVSEFSSTAGIPAVSEYVKTGGGVNTYAYPSGYSDSYGITIDGSNNVFISPQGGGSLLEVPAGTSSPGTMTAFSFPFTHSSTNIAVDHYSNLWLPYNGGLEEVKATCSGTPVSCTYSSTNTEAYGTTNPGVLAGNFAGAIDGSGNMWMDGAYSTTSTPPVAQSVLTKFAPGNNVGVVTANAAGGLGLPEYIAVDGGNNIWIADDGAPGSNTTNTGYQVTELSNSATAISGATGYWINMTSAGTALLDGPRGIAIDGSGNVWVSNSLGKPNTDGSFVTISEIVGAAVPAVTPIALAVGKNTIGQKP